MIKINNNSDRVILPMDYNPCMTYIKPVLRKHHKAMLKRNEDLSHNFDTANNLTYSLPCGLIKLGLATNLVYRVFKLSSCVIRCMLEPSNQRLYMACSLS